MYIVQTYSQAIRQAAEKNLKEIVMMPCFPLLADPSENQEAARLMLSTIHAELAMHPGINVTLIARSEDESKALKAALGSIEETC
jgi:hypothetical protein